MRTAALATFALVLCACGARGGAAGDAGTPDGAEATTGPRSFDVVATLTATSAASLPATNRFTLRIDPAAGQAIGGGGGEAHAVALGSDDGRSFSIRAAIGVGVSQSPCSGLVRVAYETLDFTVTDAKLTGHAAGHAFFAAPGGAPPPVAFDATLDGVPDKTPPSLIVHPSGAASDPLAPFQVWTSEPLPASALARLVGGDGAVSGLVPEMVEGAVPLIASFAKPTLTLPPGATFDALYSDDVTDLAGNAAPLGVAVRLPSVDAAPLVPPDGFESAAGDTLGGAAILRSGPGIPIAGAASAYIGGSDAPAPAGVVLSPRLVVRMTVPPAATKLAFSYRELALGDKNDLGSVQIGSVGRAPGPAMPLQVPPTFEPVIWSARTLDESALATMEVPLPDAIGAEVIVVIRTSATCPTGAGSPGLLVDDLRLE